MNVLQTTDQELALDRRCAFTHQVAALFWLQWRHSRHLEPVTSNRKSYCVNRRNNRAKFHPDPIWNAWAFFEAVAPTRRTSTRKTRRVAIWDQFLIEKIDFKRQYSLINDLQWKACVQVNVRVEVTTNWTLFLHLKNTDFIHWILKPEIKYIYSIPNLMPSYRRHFSVNINLKN